MDIYIYNLYDLYNRARPGGSIAGPAVHCRPGGPIARPSGSISLYIISIKYIYIYIYIICMIYIIEQGPAVPGDLALDFGLGDLALASMSRWGARAPHTPCS